MPLDKIKAFRDRTRPIKTIDLLNVSMELGQKTKVQVVDVTAAPTSDKTTTAGVIVEGVGWKDVRVGMTREELIRRRANRIRIRLRTG